MYADNESLEDIEHQTAKLQFPLLRQQISSRCKQAESFNGAREIADLITFLANDTYSNLINKRIQYQKLLALAINVRGPEFYARRLVNASLRLAALIFRSIFPHNNLPEARGEVIFSDSRNFALLDKYIRKQERFEHLLQNCSGRYISQRKGIAKESYGEIDIMPILNAVEVETHLKFAS